MQYSDTLPLINEIESQFPVDTWQVSGIHVWPTIRLKLLHHWRSTAEGDKVSDRGKSGFFRRMWVVVGSLLLSSVRFFAAFWGDFAHNARLSRADVVMLDQSVSRIFSIEGRHYNVFADALAETLEGFGLSSVLLEFASKNQYRTPRHRSSCLIQPLVFMSGLRAKWLRKFEQPEHLPRYDEFLSWLVQRRCSIASIQPQDIRQSAATMRAYADCFKYILKKVRPRYAFVVTFYNQIGMAFSVACRELSIPVVDIQHGVQGGHHAAYGFWGNIPPNGFNCIPHLFWCWSRHEVENIDLWSKRRPQAHRALVVGNLYLNMFRDRESGVVLYFDRQMAETKSRTNASFHVLVTMQPCQSSFDFFKKLYAISPVTWCWWLRLHPSMLLDLPDLVAEVQAMSHGNVNVKEATGFPLYTILQHIDAHVTQFSSTVIEARSFGVVSIACDERARLHYDQEIREGFLTVVSEYEDVIRHLLECESRIQSVSPTKMSIGPKSGINDRVAALLDTCDQMRLTICSANRSG